VSVLLISPDTRLGTDHIRSNPTLSDNTLRPKEISSGVKSGNNLYDFLYCFGAGNFVKKFEGP
jgi:hypothetical protein